jgi:ethanolamine-phosphate cytidylyltransferase
MNLNERLLSVLGCKFIDDVLIDAPWEITREMIASLKITYVVAGTISDCEEPTSLKREKYYTIPKEMGIFKEVLSQCTLTVGDIVDRVLNNEGLYKQKVKRKMAAENEYYSKRYGFDVGVGGAEGRKGDRNGEDGQSETKKSVVIPTMPTMSL